MRESNQSDFDRRCTVPIFQFIYYIKSSFINEYDPVCNIPNCYIVYMYDYLTKNYIQHSASQMFKPDTLSTIIFLVVIFLTRIDPFNDT